MGFIGGANDSNAKRIYEHQCENTCGRPAVEQVESNMYPWRFRVVDLKELFPNNRIRGFNWTSAAYQAGGDGNSSGELYTTAVNPDALISKIQSKGYNIYDNNLRQQLKNESGTTEDQALLIQNYEKYLAEEAADDSEVDYSFKLTRQNIKNIRTYNATVADHNQDGSKNYLDYDMTCTFGYTTAPNRRVCTSNFLDNPDYITYNTGFTKEDRKKISVCNNAVNHNSCDN